MPLLPDPGSWLRLSPWVDELLELDHDARHKRLARWETEDPATAQQLRRLIEPLTRLEGAAFLERPVQLPDAEAAGQPVGPYRLVREIGQGGMGSVWLAERADGRFEGRVAIKFIQLGLGSATARARFEREGRILARLEHPHIARLLDAGTVDGRPYLVLEHVDGLPIDRYCDVHQLNVARRLALLVDVLAAVAHAHARLTLHRDLKPSNILVNDAGVVKLLDFGIAKLLDEAAGPAAPSELTQAAGRPCTPLHAAPEQVQGGDLTTATDVYALGVLAYLLLTGAHPTSRSDAGTLELMQSVVEVDPPLMSLRAPARRRELRGDLELVVAKALRKAPAQRYVNAADFAADLQRVMRGAPVVARPGSRAYRLRRFVARHRLGVAAGTVSVLALAFGAGLATWQALEADHQRVQAEGLIEFMLGDLRDRLQPVGRLDALESVGAKALAYYAAQDERALGAAALSRRSRALHLIGEMAETRGDLAQAAAVFARAASGTAELLVRAPHDGQRLYDHAQSVFWVGYMAWRQGRLAAAEQAFREYERLAARLVALDATNTDWRAEQALAQTNLGTVLLDAGRLPQARELLRSARATLETLVPARPALALDLANTLGWLARAEERLGQPGAAITNVRSLIALRERDAAGGDMRARAALATAQSQLAALELLRGDARAAAGHARQAIQAQRMLLQHEPANTFWRQELAWSHLRLAEASWPADAAAAREQVSQAEALVAALERQAAEVAGWQVLQGRWRLIAAMTAPAAEAATRHDALKAWLAEVGTPPPHALREIAARGWLLLGDAQAGAGQIDAARAAWRAAARDAEADTGEPLLVTLQSLALLRLQETSRARSLAGQVASAELRHTASAELQHRLGADAVRTGLASSGATP